MHDKTIRRLATAGLIAAAIILLTALVSIPLPGGHGYINLGDVGVFAAAFVLGGPWGALCAGIASAASDLLLGWAIYAPATFIIKGCMALLCGLLIQRKSGSVRSWIVYPCALAVPVGYFLFESLLYGVAAALPNLPLNLLQCLFGAALAHALIMVLSKHTETFRLVGEPVQGKIVRDPKGGADVILIGCPAQTPTLLKAADLLSVQGYTGRIVQLNSHITVQALSASEKARLLTENTPYVEISACGNFAGATAEDIAKAALEAIHHDL